MLMVALLAPAITDASATSIDEGLPQYIYITAKDVEEKAQMGPITYDKVIITGDLSLDNPHNGYIKITNSRIAGNVYCKGITFMDKVDFINTSFDGEVVFSAAKFLAESNFTESRFRGDTSFNMSSFAEGTTFDLAVFDGLADFANAKFDKFISFYNASFSGDALFYMSQFSGAYANFEQTCYLRDADFSGCQFNTFTSYAGSVFRKTAYFQGSKFVNGVSYQYAEFIGDVNFVRSHLIEDSFLSDICFRSIANFMNTKFDGPVFLNNTRFSKDALFNNAQFLAPADLSDAVFERDLEMNGTKINTMVMGESAFQEGSRLFLARADINRLMVSWSQIKGILIYDSSAYLALVKNFKDLGLGNDANDCYYQYRRENQMRKDMGVSKFLDVVAWLSCGYGVRPHYTLICGAAIMLIFAIIIWTGRAVEGSGDLSGRQKIAASLYYSMIAFTANSKGLPLRGSYKYVGMAEGILGWLLMALFLVTLGRLIIG